MVNLGGLSNLAQHIIAWGGAAAVVYGGWAWLAPKISRRWRDWFESTVAVNVTEPIMLQVASRLEPIENSIKYIRGQLTHDGGETVKDVVFSVKRDISALSARLDAVRGHVSVSSDMRFEASPDGKNIWCSPGYLRWLGRTESQMRGWGWVSALDPENRDDVLNDWRSAIELGREFFRANVTFTHSTGYQLHAEVEAVPMRSESGNIHTWIGRVVPLQVLPISESDPS